MTAEPPPARLIAILSVALGDVVTELHSRLEDEGYGDIRPPYGYVFGTLGPDGARLTEIAERANITKQSMGELVTDMERLGYVERVPDPTDGRAKLLRLTPHGAKAQATGFRILDEIEARWAEQYGIKRVAEMRALLQEHARGPRWEAPSGAVLS